jgi:hypothetical protein
MNKYSLKKLGGISFFTGVFFLPSTLFFGGIFLLISATVGTFINKRKYLSDNWNKSFFVCGVLIIISSLKNYFFTNSLLTNEFDPKLSLIGTLNWLPFFWLFWGFQPFLDSTEKRKAASIFLIAGTFPLIVSGFGQYFFNWTGPFELLNGLIIWYQRPIDTHGLTGPFNNQNYAGSWFSLVFPFCIALLLEKTKNSLNRIFSLFFLFSIGISGILTNSRNAWASLISSIPLVVGIKSLYWYVPLIISVTFIIFITVFEPLSGGLQDLLRGLIPEKIWLEFSETRISNLDITRIEILLSAYRISILNPIFGLGAGSFPIIFELQKNLWKSHPHNIILELAISFGYPASILFISTISILFIKSAKIIFVKNHQKVEFYFFERAWWTSIFLFFISQLFDVQYFDGRISVVVWIMLCGLKLRLEEEISSTKIPT